LKTHKFKAFIDEVIGPFKNADELKAYIKSLPDEDE